MAKNIVKKHATAKKSGGKSEKIKKKKPVQKAKPKEVMMEPVNKSIPKIPDLANIPESECVSESGPAQASKDESKPKAREESANPKAGVPASVQPKRERSTFSTHDFQNECLAEMAANGLAPDGSLMVTGKINRYSIDAKKSEKDEWYIAHEFDFELSDGGRQYQLICIYSSWSKDQKYTYRSWSGNRSLSGGDREKLRLIQEQRNKEVDEQLKKDADEKAARAQEFWNNAVPATLDDPYVKRKQVPPLGVRCGKNPNEYNSLMIPYYNGNGELRAIEFISLGEDGKKFTQTLGARTGNFHIINSAQIKDGDTIYIVEGWATGVSAYEAVKQVVVSTGGKNNFQNVIKILQGKFPKIKIIIAGDIGAAGEQAAQNAAKLYGCSIALPTFPDDKKTSPSGKQYTDFNDLQVACGIDEVRMQLGKVLVVKSAMEERKEIAQRYMRSIDPCKDFNLDKFPAILKNYIQQQSQGTDAPLPIIAAATLTEISAFCGPHVTVGFYGDLHMTLWILNIAPSGTHKSTALKRGARYARSNQERVNTQIKIINELIASGSDDPTLEKQRLEISREDVILPDKTTTESLVNHMALGHYGAFFLDEYGGWLQTISKKYNVDMKAFLIKAYDVDVPHRDLTISRGDCFIDNPYASICGVSTMAWVEKEIGQTDIESGFLARHLLFLHTPKRGVPGIFQSRDTITNYDTIAQYDATVKKIRNHIANGPIHITMPRETEDWLADPKAKTGVYYDIYRIIIEPVEMEQLGSILKLFFNRWIPNLVKVATIIQLMIDPDSTDLSIPAMEAAYSFIMPAIKSTMVLCEKNFGQSVFQRQREEILEYIAKKIDELKSPVPRNVIIKCNKLPGGTKEYDAILDNLEDAGRMKVNRPEPAKKLTWTYELAE